MYNNNKFCTGVALSLLSISAYANVGTITDSPVEIYTILFLVYIISLMSVGFCVWVKWEQDTIKHLMLTINKNNIETQRRLDRLDVELKKIQDKSPFPTR